MWFILHVQVCHRSILRFVSRVKLALFREAETVNLEAKICLYCPNMKELMDLTRDNYITLCNVTIKNGWNNQLMMCWQMDGLHS